MSENIDRPNRRQLDKDMNRQVLLEATARVILEYGAGGATISRIQAESGLSRGMINLHFQSKDNLIRELAHYLGERYDKLWQTFADGSSPNVTTPEEAAARMRSLFETDLSPEVLDEQIARLTVSFRAEPQLQDLAPSFLETRNTVLHNYVRRCCEVLCQACRPQSDPEKIAMAFMSLLEGLWIDFQQHPHDFDRNYAIDICLTTANAFFPDYFE
ncbi:MAG: TetR/AcrR family transcriptional regulator [Roseibium sp.]|uniref:TetR/AcrR family transcriptional regulator n=1 Tax=Roseibium sp. TaxID=1936156 RepID=UPI00260985A9|nr:TetR/AcrR family transcriptional regulator [Roseibium sp.]MCV0424192.1 TetR/AcrR family transcriptional regulator [Roseibium sp.]